ncbi:MAG: tetratricopeptide repeat protein [Ktedonobacteraceae bacterium]|nr:tetratricopeptide repeat protein [Ktedonobacteraceae bacterium]
MDDSGDQFFSELLRMYRKRRKLTQQQLGERIGASREAVSFWERGDYKPNTITMLHELARVLRLEEDEKRLLFEAHVGTASILPLHNLPEPNAYFTERTQQLQLLHQQLSEYLQVVQTQAISGLGGVGKTQLALAYAYRYRAHYHDILWASAESRETLAGSYGQLAEVLRLPEREKKDQRAVTRAVIRWLREHRGWLLILDNLEELELVREFVPGTRQGAVLFTTRLQVTEPLAHALPLESLSEEEGVLFLLRRARRLKRADPVEAASDRERLLVRQIVMLLGGLPLALDQAGAYILETGSSLEEYLALYEQRHTALLAWRGRVPVEHPDSVGTTFALAFERVERQSPAAVELLRLCAFLAPDAIPEALIVEGAELLAEPLQSVAIDPLAFNEAIEILRSLSLVQRYVQSKTLSLHRLVQTVLRDTMSEEERQTWIKRSVRLLKRAFPAGSDVLVERWGWCEQLVPHVLLNAAQCEEEGVALPEAASLWHRTATYLQTRAQYEQAEPLYQHAVRLREQVLGPEHPEVAKPLNGLAILYETQGRHVEAERLYQRALHIWEQASGPEHPELAYPLNGLAIVYIEQDRFAEAEPLLQRVLDMREQELGPEHPEVAYPLNNLAETYRRRNRFAEAEPLYQRALHIREQTLGSEHPETGYPIYNLAEIYREQGQYKQAESWYRRALRIWEQVLGIEHPLVAHPLNGLAQIYRKQERHAEAEPLALRALTIRERALGDEHPDTAESLSTLSTIYQEQGRYEEAEPLMRRALTIQERVLRAEHPKLLGLLECYADLLKKLGREEEAAGYEARARATR